MIAPQGAPPVLGGDRNAVSLRSEPVSTPDSKLVAKFSSVLQESARQQDRDIVQNSTSREELQTTTADLSTPFSFSTERRENPRPADLNPAPTRSGNERESTNAAEGMEASKAKDTERSADLKMPSKSPSVSNDDPLEEFTEMDESLSWTSAANSPGKESSRPSALAWLLTGPQDHEKPPGTVEDHPHATSTMTEAYPVALQTAAPAPANTALQTSPQKLFAESAHANAGPLAKRPAGAAGTELVAGTVTPAASDLPALPGWLQQFNKTTGLNADPQTPAVPLAGLVAAPGGPSHTLSAGPLAPPTPPHVAPGSPEFSQQLGMEVMLMARNGGGRATLTLNPADLGPIQIDLKIHTQVADLSFAVTHATTREAITQSLPKLGEMLAAQGLSLGSSHVGGEGAKHNASTTQQDAGSPGGNGWNSHNSGRRVGHAMDQRSLVALAASARGGVDLYA